MSRLPGLLLRVIMYYTFIMSVSWLFDLNADSYNAFLCSTALSMLYLPLARFIDKIICEGAKFSEKTANKE